MNHATQHITRLTLCLMVMLSVVVHVGAQSNALGLDDRMAALLSRADGNRRTPLGLAQADSLQRLGANHNNYYVQCVALGLKAVYYQHTDDDASFERVCTQLERMATRHNVKSYYYFSKIRRIERLVDNNHLTRASVLIRKTRNEAVADRIGYGLYALTAIEAAVYFKLYKYEQGDSCLKAGLVIKDKLKLNYNSTSVYTILAESARLYNRYDEAIRYSRRCVNEAILLNDKLTGMANLTMALFEAHRISEFRTAYDKFISMRKGHNFSKTDYVRMLNAYKYAADNDAEAAVKCASQITDDDKRNYALYSIYVYQGQWKNAYYNLKGQTERLRTAFNSILHTELADMNLGQGNMTLSMHNNTLARQNALLLLEQNQMQMGIDSVTYQHNINMLAKRDMELSGLQLAQKARKATMQKQENEERLLKEQASRDKTREKYVNGIMAVGMIVLLLILIQALVLNKRHKRGLEKLRLSHEQLKEETDKAAMADRAQTAFLEKMNHSIRTPLNAVLGFSQLLCENGEQLSEEEQSEYMKHIQSNADMLSELINGILDEASKANASHGE